jgi:hypothetical protein
MAQKIRLGLIGASVRGTWSLRSHLPAARASAEIELTAVCTTRADSVEAARAAYGARLAFWRLAQDGDLAGYGRERRSIRGLSVEEHLVRLRESLLPLAEHYGRVLSSALAVLEALRLAPSQAVERSRPTKVSIRFE